MGKPYRHLVGSRFVPNDLGLVRYPLRNMVERKQSSVDITTMDVYQAEPWLLPHVRNPLFKKKEWYYYFPKTKTRSRSVPGRGGSKAGFWRSGVRKEDIKDGNKIIGYKTPLTYHTIVNGEKKKTDWRMTEYSLHGVGKGFQDWALCMIRDKTKTKVDKRINHVPQTQTQPRPHSQYQLQPQPQVAAENTNNILPNQLVHKEADFTGFAEELETMMLEGQEDREATEQQQEEEIPQIHDNNNNNVMMWNQQVQKEADLTSFADELETIMLEGQEDRDITEQQQEEEIPMIPLGQIHNNSKNVMMMSNQQVQEEAADLTGFADELETIMLEGDGDATEQVQEEACLASLANELDMLMREGEKDRVIQLQQQQVYEETQSGNNDVIPTPPPMNNNKKDIMIRLGGQEEREFTQQQQKQVEEVLPIPPPMHNNNDDDDVMMKWRQDLFDIEEFLMKDNEGEDVTEQEERFQLLVQPIYQAQEWSQLVGDQEDDTMMMIDNPNNAQALGNYEFTSIYAVLRTGQT